MNVNFQQFFVVVKMTERRKNGGIDFTQLFIYFITVSKYQFCISVIGYINMQIIGIGYKKNLYRLITKHDINILMIFGRKEYSIILTHTMHVWILLHLDPCYLRLF